jgi:hypothetical protein
MSRNLYKPEFCSAFVRPPQSGLKDEQAARNLEDDRQLNRPPSHTQMLPHFLTQSVTSALTHSKPTPGAGFHLGVLLISSNSSALLSTCSALQSASAAFISAKAGAASAIARSAATRSAADLSVWESEQSR